MPAAVAPAAKVSPCNFFMISYIWAVSIEAAFFLNKTWYNTDFNYGYSGRFSVGINRLERDTRQTARHPTRLSRYIA